MYILKSEISDCIMQSEWARIDRSMHCVMIMKIFVYCHKAVLVRISGQIIIIHNLKTRQNIVFLKYPYIETAISDGRQYSP